MSYSNNLNATKKNYPFEKWRSYFFPIPEEDYDGMSQYTEENCQEATFIFDTLIQQLIDLGEASPKGPKEALFEKAINDLNALNDATDHSLIETGEREELCELIDEITLAANLNPKDYADGDGIADLWREW